ncbi:1,4-beta-D-glucan glucohydrolase [Vibrio neptunius]|uniref:glycoside hydrolase family 3 protein n=1 Tax=Vibrio neptunius TaxID=170651 RepID=UPI0005FA65A9|nr:glycoside hydrolase family 3 N-terminal domain-containing protein [Vibrio neptunius]KJY86937.1 1,4-beta-D-glucan glucohydrolase [Vibrio neptunius]
MHNEHKSLPYYSDWPQLVSEVAVDPAIESAIALIVQQMTLEEKIGQMIQPEIREVTIEEFKQYKFGSILNGGGAWPNDNKRASAQEWAEKADEFWHATQEMFVDRPFTIPFVWATDAVHGHNNAFGATVFPHNIGLGCARDPELIRRIGRITALEIVATGLDWTFAPTVATPRDLRWGRVYEGYSEDPQITFQYAREMVKGLQGTQDELKDQAHVLSNVKHWVGDGGTKAGVDRGVNNYSEDHLRNIHAMGYFSGLEAGAQVVMSSFNSWANKANYDHSSEHAESYNDKVHGSKYLIHDVLKKKMGFDGLVVTDWHGHAEVSLCSDGNANYAINAGNDVLMVPIREHWLAVYHNALEGVKKGEIPQARIDDAVRRILRVKMRAGLWDKPAPTQRQYAGQQSVLGAISHRETAREAVRKSLVLLKNKGDILPLHSSQKILLTGSAANDIQKQTGGWNLTWQGDENSLDDFPGATTLKMALEQELGADKVTYDPYLNSDYKASDIAIVAFGEDPYAEMMGDIKAWQSLDFATLKRSYAQDCRWIDKLHHAGVKVISVFFSGRPLYVNEQIARSDAFVAAFLPGSEGKGITDILVGDSTGQPRGDFCGKLSFSWPNTKRSTAVNVTPSHIPDYVVPEIEQPPHGEHTPLFEYGYGLSYSNQTRSKDLDNLVFDTETESEANTAMQAQHMYGIQASVGDYLLKIADIKHWMGADVSRNNTVSLSHINSKPYNYQQQQDAVELTIQSPGGMAYIQPASDQAEDLSHFRGNGVVRFEVKRVKHSNARIHLSLQKSLGETIRPHGLYVDLTEAFNIPVGEFTQVIVPCSDLVNDEDELSCVDTPFLLSIEGEAQFVIANICWDIIE